MVGATSLLSVGCLAAMPSGEVKVIGEIASPRCEIIAPNSGVYDFGRISRSSGTQGWINLPVITQSWRVKCSSAAYMDIIPQDNRFRPGADMGAAYFSLGGNGTRTLGRYLLGVSNARIDQMAVIPQTSGQPTSRSGITTLVPGVRTRWLVPENNVTRAGSSAGRLFSVDITVSPRLTLPDNEAVEAMSLDGSATLDFTFGI